LGAGIVPHAEPPADESPFLRLIASARSGDREAMGQLLAEFRNYLLLVANERLQENMQAKIGPSDIVQQSMMVAWEKLHQFRGESESEFRNWLRKIVINDIRDTNRYFQQAKRRHVHRESSLDDSRRGRPEPSDPLLTPGTDALLREQAEMLNEAMSHLSPQHRQILKYRNWDELGFSEIGEMMNCSPDAARKLWYRAVLKLQDLFRKQNPGMESAFIDTMIDKPDADESA
jgi:RNA polymerase sigma-70 factor (subfamily 1)